MTDRPGLIVLVVAAAAGSAACLALGLPVAVAVAWAILLGALVGVVGYYIPSRRRP